MGMASSKIYKPSDAELMADHYEKADTNVFSIGFFILQDALKPLVRNPVACQNCGAIFNSRSKTAEPGKDEGIVNKDIQISKEDLIAQGINAIWVCEFCSNHNFIKIEKEDYTEKEDCLYQIGKPNDEKVQEKENNEESKQDAKGVKGGSDSSVVFCIDYSGSMGQTSKLASSLKFSKGAEELFGVIFEEEFPDPDGNKNIIQKKDLSKLQYISRREAVLLAACHQMQEMQNKQPDRKVGAVAFSSTVSVIGDGSQKPAKYAGDVLNNFETLLDNGKKLYNEHMMNTILDNFEILMKKLAKHPEGGSTALGPAVTVALGLASQGKPGSSVIICTDGLANVGLGRTESSADLAAANAFYQKLGEFARDNGIIVSVVTMKGEECKVDMLGKIADATNGIVLRVSPETMSEDFAKVMGEEVIGTKVELKLVLHRALKFRNENPDNLKVDGSICTKVIGNVTKRTERSFEYEIKSLLDQQAQGIDLTGLDEIPFQAQITYELPDGSKYLRVINKSQNVSNDKKEVEQNARVDILATNAAQRNADLALQGKLAEAEENSKKWGSYMSKDIMSNAQKAEQLAQVENFQKQNLAFASAVQQQKEKKVSGKDADDLATNMYNMKQINSSYWNQK